MGLSLNSTGKSILGTGVVTYGLTALVNQSYTDSSNFIITTAAVGLKLLYDNYHVKSPIKKFNEIKDTFYHRTGW